MVLDTAWRASDAYVGLSVNGVRFIRRIRAMVLTSYIGTVTPESSDIWCDGAIQPDWGRAAKFESLNHLTWGKVRDSGEK